MEENSKNTVLWGHMAPSLETVLFNLYDSEHAGGLWPGALPALPEPQAALPQPSASSCSGAAASGRSTSTWRATTLHAVCRAVSCPGWAADGGVPRHCAAALPLWKGALHAAGRQDDENSEQFHRRGSCSVLRIGAEAGGRQVPECSMVKPRMSVWHCASETRGTPTVSGWFSRASEHPTTPNALAAATRVGCWTAPPAQGVFKKNKCRTEFIDSDGHSCLATERGTMVMFSRGEQWRCLRFCSAAVWWTFSCDPRQASDTAQRQCGGHSHVTRDRYPQCNCAENCGESQVQFVVVDVIVIFGFSCAEQ